MRYALATAALACVLSTLDAAAHPLAPGLLALEETAAGGSFVARFRPPRSAPHLRPVWPPACRVSSGERLDCGAHGLAGAMLAVEGWERGGAPVLARVRLADGRIAVSWLTAAEPRFSVPVRASRAALFADHARLGVGHLLGGLDHVLFVAGLVALLRRGRALWLAVTAFTAGHSATLALAVLDLARVPAALVEPAIAATLVVLAFELARNVERPSSASRFARRPLALPFAFGLLHGLGFATALDWLGVARADLPAALAGFNLGIEAAQLVLVAALLVLGAGLARIAPRARPRAAFGLVPVYAIGTLGVYWLLTRCAEALAEL